MSKVTMPATPLTRVPIETKKKTVPTKRIHNPTSRRDAAAPSLTTLATGFTLPISNLAVSSHITPQKKSEVKGILKRHKEQLHCDTKKYEEMERTPTVKIIDTSIETFHYY